MAVPAVAATFAARKATTDIWTPRIEAWLRRRPRVRRVTNVEGDPVYQQQDIDLLIEGRTAGITTADVKVDLLAHRTGNLFFETISNDQRQTLGCFRASAATAFLYYLAGDDRLVILRLARVRPWFDAWLARTEGTPQGICRRTVTVGPDGKARYGTRGYAVPLRALLDPVTGSKGVWSVQLSDELGPV